MEPGYEYTRNTFEDDSERNASSNYTEEMDDDQEPEAKPTLYSVGLYLCDRAFGGPEEGGWYYACGELVTDPAIYMELGLVPTVHTTEHSARAAQDAMRQAVIATGLNDGRREISSVLSDGQYFAEIHEGILPPFYPAERPRYE